MKDDRVCPSCGEQIHLDQFGTEDLWRMEHRSGILTCAWIASNGTSTARMSLATAKGAAKSVRAGIPKLGKMTTISTATATTGGSLTAATYGYKVTVLTAYGEGTASDEATKTVPPGTATNTVTLTWTAVPKSGNNAPTGYRVYGRTSGGPWLKMGDATASPYVDDGSVTPSGAINATDTTDAD